MGWPAELQEAVDCIDVRDSCVRSRSLMVLQAAVAPLGPCAQSTCVSLRASSWPALLGPRDPQRAVGICTLKKLPGDSDVLLLKGPGTKKAP